MLPNFGNDEKSDDSKIRASVLTMPEQLETGRKFEGNKTRCKTLIPKKCTYTIRIDKSRSKSVEKYSVFIIFECSHDAVSKMCRLQFRCPNLPFSKSADKNCAVFMGMGGLSVTFLSFSKCAGSA